MHRLTWPKIAETLIIEYGFLDNPSDLVKLLDEYFRQKLAEAVLKEVCTYYAVPYFAPAVQDPATNIALFDFSRAQS